MIKTIYTFGTSCTAGGGFEFDCKYRHTDSAGFKMKISRGEYIKNIYSETPFSQNHYSYPGQLQSLLSEYSHKIRVENISKQGYGNERIYRKFFEITNFNNFNKEQSLFIFEFSDLSRKEFYFTPLKNHVIMNYKAEPDDSDMKNMSISKSYWYDTARDYKTISENYHIFKEFRENFISTDNQLIEITRNYILFLEFLQSNGFNFLISGVPEITHPKYFNEERKWKKYIIPFGFDNDIKYETFNIFADEQKLRIQDETSGEYGDLHPSLFANKIIAKMVYNDMIKRNYITGDIIPIPKKINFKENLKNTLI